MADCQREAMGASALVSISSLSSGVGLFMRHRNPPTVVSSTRSPLKRTAVPSNMLLPLRGLATSPSWSKVSPANRSLGGSHSNCALFADLLRGSRLAGPAAG